MIAPCPFHERWFIIKPVIRTTIYNSMGQPSRIAVVPGASRKQGMGAAICRALAAQGCDIFFTCWSTYDRDTYGLEEGGPAGLLQELQAHGVNCAYMEADLSRPE